MNHRRGAVAMVFLVNAVPEDVQVCEEKGGYENGGREGTRILYTSVRP